MSAGDGAAAPLLGATGSGRTNASPPDGPGVAVPRWGMSIGSLLLGLLTLFVFRRGLPYVGWIVGYLLLLWLVFALFTEWQAPLEEKSSQGIGEPCGSAPSWARAAPASPALCAERLAAHWHGETLPLRHRSLGRWTRGAPSAGWVRDSPVLCSRAMSYRRALRTAAARP